MNIDFPSISFIKNPGNFLSFIQEHVENGRDLRSEALASPFHVGLRGLHNYAHLSVLVP